MNDELIQNAEKVIERFGGIRPMAKKLNVPVTTVQGWKSRNTIPFNRREDLLDAATIHRIDMSDFAWAQMVASISPVAANDHDSAEIISKAKVRNTDNQNETYNDIDMGQVRKQSFITSVLTSIVIVILVGGAVFALFNQQTKKAIPADENKVAVLEQRLAALENTPKTDMATDLAARLGNLMGWLGYDEQTAAQGTPLRTFTDRLSVIETQLETLNTGSPQQLGAALQSATGTAIGNQDVQAMFDVLRGRLDGLETTVKSASDTGVVAANAVQQLSSQDVTAAGLLLALVQFRSATARTTNFTNDLELVKQMVGQSDPELTQRLDQLAPYAANGVMAPAALKTELQGLASDVALSAIKGENLNLMDKIKLRLQNFFTLKKDGETVLGAKGLEQDVITKAQAQLKAGDAQGALVTLKTLDQTAQQPLAGLLQQTEAAALVQQIDGDLVAKIKSVLSARQTAIPSVNNGTTPLPIAR